MSLILRPYQEDLIQKLRLSIKKGNNRLILCAPTGAGKTAKFSFMVKNHIEKGGKALIFTHRKELLTQAGGSFNRLDLQPEFITANSKPDLSNNLHVSMVETFYRRIEKYADFLNSRTMIIFDEAHLTTFDKIIPYINKDTYVIGATATPFRKGKQLCLSEMYNELIQGVDTPDLIKLGYLSYAKSYGVDIEMKGMKRSGSDYDTSEYYESNKTYIGVVENYKRLSENKKTILFSSNVESSKVVTNEFLKNGYNAKHIDGTTPKSERQEILKWFNDTPDAIICNCGILNAGFDQPDIETVILYRATTSLPLFLQMCGRGSRVTETKKQFTILDFGNNIKRHNFWEHPRVWDIHKKVTKEKPAPVKTCKKCGAINPVSKKTCDVCNELFPIKARDLKRIDLVELSKTNSPYLVDLVNKINKKQLSAKYVLHNMSNKEDALKLIELLGYKKGWLHFNKDRYAVFRR